LNEEEKRLLEESNRLIKEYRERLEKMEKGVHTKNDFETFEAKMDKRLDEIDARKKELEAAREEIKAANERIDELETKFGRPGMGGAEGEDNGEGLASKQYKSAFMSWARKGKAALGPELRQHLGRIWRTHGDAERNHQGHH